MHPILYLVEEEAPVFVSRIKFPAMYLFTVDILEAIGQAMAAWIKLTWDIPVKAE